VRTIIRLIASLFFLGYLPFIPGTIASLAGLGLCLLIKGNQNLYLIVTAAVVCLGFLVAGRAERIFAARDARQIVIDELAGVLIALWLLPQELIYLITGFVIYRLLDWLKPYPLKRLEKLPGSLGIMLDDIGAGIYTNIILQITVCFFIR
jgi:phosphatidylglycerophosphatase A